MLQHSKQHAYNTSSQIASIGSIHDVLLQLQRGLRSYRCKWEVIRLSVCGSIDHHVAGIIKLHICCQSARQDDQMLQHCRQAQHSPHVHHLHMDRLP